MEEEEEEEEMSLRMTEAEAVMEAKGNGLEEGGERGMEGCVGAVDEEGEGRDEDNGVGFCAFEEEIEEEEDEEDEVDDDDATEEEIFLLSCEGEGEGAIGDDVAELIAEVMAEAVLDCEGGDEEV